MRGANIELAKFVLARLSAKDRQILLRELAGQPEQSQSDKILRRAQVAKQFGVSLGAIDLWGKQGILQRIKLPNRVRACGYRESDVCALIRGAN